MSWFPHLHLSKGNEKQTETKLETKMFPVFALEKGRLKSGNERFLSLVGIGNHQGMHGFQKNRHRPYESVKKQSDSGRSQSLYPTRRHSKASKRAFNGFSLRFSGIVGRISIMNAVNFNNGRTLSASSPEAKRLLAQIDLETMELKSLQKSRQRGEEISRCRSARLRRAASSSITSD